ncbi:MAG: hypothetical protein ACI8XU_002734 [Kiritimatiellia bacterium]|jgi:hypothetical protein
MGVLVQNKTVFAEEWFELIDELRARVTDDMLPGTLACSRFEHRLQYRDNADEYWHADHLYSL